MSLGLTLSQIKTIKEELLQLQESLQEELAAELADKQGARKTASFTGAHDLGDDAQADVDSSVSLMNVSRHMHELNDCQTALRQLEQGDYGFCMDCGEPIELSRLKANPTALRCLACQSEYEHARPEMKHASL